jgi:hypothetical protein
VRVGLQFAWLTMENGQERDIKSFLPGTMHPYFNEKIFFSLDVEHSKKPYGYQE